MDDIRRMVSPETGALRVNLPVVENWPEHPIASENIIISQAAELLLNRDLILKCICPGPRLDLGSEWGYTPTQDS